MGFRYSIQQPGVVNRDSVHIGALRARRHTLSNYELSYLERSSTGSLNRQRLRILGRIDHINLPSGKGSAQIILLTVETNTTALVSLTRLAVQKCSRHDIDFEQNTITIRHTVTSCDLDGKRILVASDTTKTKSSMRTLPLVPFMRERLLALKDEQEENRRLCGRSYIKDYIGYVCVNEIGDLIKPHYVTESFPKLLKANGLRHIRFHDLRHSCASLLLANGVPMKQIQEWLGHSDFSTTANIYAHLDYSSKLTSADAMLNGLGLVPN